MSTIHNHSAENKAVERTWGAQIPDFTLTSAMLSQLESMSGFIAEPLPGAAWDVPCDWKVRVVKGSYEGRPAFKVFSMEIPRLYGLVIDAGRAANWDDAKHLCLRYSSQAKWKLPTGIEIVYAAMYGLLPRYDLLPGAEFGLLWSRAETPEEDRKIFKGTSNFTSMDLRARTRVTVNLDEQIERHEELARALRLEPPTDPEVKAERRRVQKVLGGLREGIPVYGVAGALHPFCRDSYYARPAPRFVHSLE